jgi:spore germination protein
MAYDVLILALKSILVKVKRMTLILILSPLLYVMAMVPNNVIELKMISDWIGVLGILFGFFVPVLLYVLAMWRGAKR